MLLDGAHNPSGAAALAAALDDLRPYLADGPLTLITASMADKDVDGVIAALIGVPPGADRAGGRALADATVVCTTVPGMARALSADELAARWSRITAEGKPAARSGARSAAPKITAEPDPLGAIDRAIGTGRGPVVVAGSLYLVGMARGHLVDDPALRDPARGTFAGTSAHG